MIFAVCLVMFLLDDGLNHLGFQTGTLVWWAGMLAGIAAFFLIVKKLNEVQVK